MKHNFKLSLDVWYAGADNYLKMARDFKISYKCNFDVRFVNF